MKERRYKEDFKLVTKIDPDTGREKRVAEYIGKYYRISLDSHEMKHFKLQCTGLCLLSFAALVGYILLNSPSAFCMYVMPIAALSLFPMLYWAMGVYSMFFCQNNMTIVQKETGVGRVLRSALGCMVFPALAIIGDIVFLCKGADFAKELPALLLMALSSASAGLCFARARRVYNNISVVSNAKEAPEA